METNDFSFCQTDKEVLLIFPGKFGASEPQIPLSILNIASYLDKAGYNVKIFDMRVENPKNIDIGNPVFVGISSMSGSQISYGLEIAKKIRNYNEKIPIVWGGVHPTLLPEQTVSNRHVDIVVRGEGEFTSVKLANQLYLSGSLESVKGITYKKQGKIVSNPEESFIDLNSIPIKLPYDLLNVDSYPTLKAGRMHIQTSRGCPGKCSFCYNTLFNHKIWRAKNAQRVLDEIEYLIKKFPHVSKFDPIDDNFFVDKKRVEEICKGLLDRKIKIKWRANCRFDNLADFSQEFISLLDRSGCVELDFGGESGSQKLQTLVVKDISFIQMIKAVEKLKLYGPHIEPFISWISGLPGETYTDLSKTFNFMDQLSRINPKTQHYNIFVYTPFPSPLLESLPSDFKPPKNLEEWGKIEVFHYDPPWHPKKYVSRLHTISGVTQYAFYPNNRIREYGFFFRSAYLIMNRIAKFRWRHRFFGFPIELAFADFVTKKLRGFL